MPIQDRESKPSARRGIIQQNNVLDRKEGEKDENRIYWTWNHGRIHV